MQKVNLLRSVGVALLSIAVLTNFPLARTSDHDAYWDNSITLSNPRTIGIWAISPQDSNFIVGGYFNEIGGIKATNIARWDGRSWHAIGQGLGDNPHTLVSALAVDGNTIYAGGDFTRSGSLPIRHFAKWDGSNWTEVGGGADGTVFAIALAGDRVFVAGRFTEAGGAPALNIAAWDGKSWTSLGNGLSKKIYAEGTVREVARVNALAFFGGDLYAAGEFDYAGGIGATNIAKWNGRSWTSLGPGLDSLGVNQLVSVGGALYAGGTFKHAGALPVFSIAKWDGTQWSPLGTGVDDGRTVQALATDGRYLYAAGTFRQIGGIAASRIAKWDGAAWLPLGSGIDPQNPAAGIGKLACNGAELLVSGSFNLVGNKPATNIAIYQIPGALKLNCSSGLLNLSWPAADFRMAVETATHLNGSWSEISTTLAFRQNRWTITTNFCSQNTFFRLRRK